MNDEIGAMREDSSRDVFWQRSCVNGQRRTRCKIVVAASQEALSDKLHIPMKDIRENPKVDEWFMAETHKLIDHFSLVQNQEEVPDLMKCLGNVQSFANTL